MGALLAALAGLLQSLPEILKLIQTLNAQIAQANTDRKVKDDFAKINEAFDKKDPSLLDHLFK